MSENTLYSRKTSGRSLESKVLFDSVKGCQTAQRAPGNISASVVSRDTVGSVCDCGDGVSASGAAADCGEGASASGSAADRYDEEVRRWLAKYSPEEMRIITAYNGRMNRRAARRRARDRAFGDLCEASEGEAVKWRRKDWTPEDLLVPMTTDAWTRQCLERYFKLANEEPRLEGLPTYFAHSFYTALILLGSVTNVAILLVLLGIMAHDACKLVSVFKKRIHRPLYYEREAARRHSLAGARRRIVKRVTTSPCPTKEEIFDAWLHVKESKEAAVRFGSLLNDLECYVDNSLRFTDGRITGREAGIKGWLALNIPVLVYKYKTVMRYKAMAKKLRQIVELTDPVPVAVVLAETAEVPADTQIVRAAALWGEVAVKPMNVTSLAARIDALTDPEKIEDANMLATWRERYKKEITEENKSRWWRKILAKVKKEPQDEEAARPPTVEKELAKVLA